MAPAPNDLLTDLLKNVSRTFYRTLRVLPASVRPQISLAYLLARTTDTIADTEIVPLEQRLKSLLSLQDRIMGSSSAPLDFAGMAQQQGSPAERVLLEKCEASLALLESMPSSDRELIREVLKTIISGQDLDLRRFSNASADRIVALQNEAELDDYTYRVAGCVGEFWTKICRTRAFPTARLNDELLLANGVRFGKGLQLVNILRDVPADLAKGRCYLPAEKLAGVGLSPADLRRPSEEPRLRPIYCKWISQAEAHLEAGQEYVACIPFRQVRIRLACSWPILIGQRTLQLLRSGNVLDPKQRIKISRSEVKRIIWKSIILYPLPLRRQGPAKK